MCLLTYFYPRKNQIECEINTMDHVTDYVSSVSYLLDTLLWINGHLSGQLELK